MILTVSLVFPNTLTRSNMHPCLNIDEILRLLVRELVVSGAKATAVALACCCKNFEEPALDVLWETQSRLTPLLKCFPRDIWKKDRKIVSQLRALIFFGLNCLVWKDFQ